MKVLLTTSQGAITLQLNTEKAPNTSANFVEYVKNGFYDGLIFHRVINGFMVQGGGFEPGMKQRPTGSPIENEASNGLKNTTGTVAMARTMDPHSATAQFFINVADNSFLDFRSETTDGWGYAVFAEVVEGMDVVNRIKALPTTFKGGHQDVPTEDILIEKAEVLD